MEMVKTASRSSQSLITNSCTLKIIESNSSTVDYPEFMYVFTQTLHMNRM